MSLKKGSVDMLETAITAIVAIIVAVIGMKAQKSNLERRVRDVKLLEGLLEDPHLKGRGRDELERNISRRKKYIARSGPWSFPDLPFLAVAGVVCIVFGFVLFLYGAIPSTVDYLKSLSLSERTSYGTALAIIGSGLILLYALFYAICFLFKKCCWHIRQCRKRKKERELKQERERKRVESVSRDEADSEVES